MKIKIDEASKDQAEIIKAATKRLTERPERGPIEIWKHKTGKWDFNRAKNTVGSKEMKRSGARLMGHVTERGYKRVSESNINEISKAVKTRYLSKAIDDHGHQNMGRRNTTDPNDKKTYSRKEKNRKRGISRAMGEELSPEEQRKVVKKHKEFKKTSKARHKVQARYNHKPVGEETINEATFTANLSDQEYQKIRKASMRGNFAHKFSRKTNGDTKFSTNLPKKLAADLEKVVGSRENSWNEILGVDAAAIKSKGKTKQTRMHMENTFAAGPFGRKIDEIYKSSQLNQKIERAEKRLAAAIKNGSIAGQKRAETDLKALKANVKEGAVPSNEKTVKVTHKTSGKELVINAKAVDKYKKMGYEIKEGLRKGEREATKKNFDVYLESTKHDSGWRKVRTYKDRYGNTVKKKNLPKHLARKGRDENIPSGTLRDVKVTDGQKQENERPVHKAFKKLKQGKATEYLKRVEDTQLDELSKGTTIRYMKKSNNDLNKQNDSLSRRSTNRETGLRRAASSLNKKGGLSTVDKIKHRTKGFLGVKEDTQLDELSKGTLKSYKSKAKPSAKLHQKKADLQYRHADYLIDREGRHPSKDPDVKVADRLGDYHDRKASNRRKGIDQAKKKLAKEDAQVNELSNKTLQSYDKKAEMDMYDHDAAALKYKKGSKERKHHEYKARKRDSGLYKAGRAMDRNDYGTDGMSKVKPKTRRKSMVHTLKQESVGEGTASGNPKLAAQLAARKAQRQAMKDKKKAGVKKTSAPSAPNKGKNATDDRHIIMQLRSAQDLNGNKDIQFRRGTGKLSKETIDTLLKVHDRLTKPNDKRKLFIAVSKSAKDAEAAAKKFAHLNI